MRTITFLLGVLAASLAPGQSYTYVSPSIASLHGHRIEWPLFNGWRLLSPAESAVYKRATMEFTLVKTEPHSLHRTSIVGAFTFGPKQAPRQNHAGNSGVELRQSVKRAVDAHSLQAVVNDPGSGNRLNVVLRAVPPVYTDFWRVEVARIRIRSVHQAK
ncbi:MAG: hypothetical protein P4L46_16510 [Fimbriimonas sp.]|nr:hypothetical protein [Fimbriimonas sp.]